MAVNYGNIVKNSNPQANGGGYKNVFYFASLASFLLLQKPTAAGTTLGDTLAIDSAHTFTAPAGFNAWACKTHSVTGKGATVGDPGASEIEWTYDFVVIGDGASTQEQLQRTLNDDIICLLKDTDCTGDSYVQLGDDCVLPTFAVAFDAKTTKDGKKEYTVTVTCKRKYFYNAAVTLAV